MNIIKKFNIPLIILMLLLCFDFIGCASVKFLGEKKVNTGFAYHPAKPYLLIIREKVTTTDKGTTTATEKATETVTVKIISIPDVSKECFVKTTGFLGSADLNLTVTDSMLTQIGAKTDSKIPDTINALAALTTSAAKILVPTGEKTTQATSSESQQQIQLYEIIEDGEGIGFKLVTDFPLSPPKNEPRPPDK